MSEKIVFIGNAELFVQKEPLDPRIALYNALNPYIEGQFQIQSEQKPNLAKRISTAETKDAVRHVAATYGTIFELGRTPDQQIKNEEVSGGKSRVVDPVYEQFLTQKKLTEDDIRLAGNIGWQALQAYRVQRDDLNHG